MATTPADTAAPADRQPADQYPAASQQGHQPTATGGGTQLYTRTAVAASRQVIGRYSTSFSWACRSLPAAARPDVECIYALVRVADEVVDGVAVAAGMDRQAVRGALDGLEAEVEDALTRGFSTNLVVHAFADVARRRGIGTELTGPFFASMRADLDTSAHDDGSLRSYIYGSAEVVGLMCLQVFLSLPGTRAETEDDRDGLRDAARRLGAAFQKVNFLRDLGADHDGLGRTYFPALADCTDGHGRLRLDEDTKAALLADLQSDLDAARPGIVALDPGARRAVLMAHGLFSELARRIAAVPAPDLVGRRVSVPSCVKAQIAAAALLGRAWRGGRGERAEPAADPATGAGQTGAGPATDAGTVRA